MAPASTREYRRFTAVMLVHPVLGAPEDVKRWLPSAVANVEKLADLPAGWDGVRAEYLQARRSFYPDRVVSRESRKRGDKGFAHDVYIATKNLGGELGSVTFVASPYTLLLTRLVEALSVATPEPGIQYADILMPAVYKWLDEDDELGALVNRVEMQIVGEAYADLVQLSGKRPLHSKVHENLKSVTVPYGVGVRVTHCGIDCRVTIDRHGVIRWFQTKEECVGHPLKLLDDINALGAFRKVRRLPLLREAKDKVVEEEQW